MKNLDEYVFKVFHFTYLLKTFPWGDFLYAAADGHHHCLPNYFGVCICVTVSIKIL